MMRKSTWVSLLLLLVVVTHPLVDLWRVHVARAQAADMLLDFSQIPPPQSIAEREAQFVQRAQVVIDAAACGMDDPFNGWVREFRDPNTPQDGFHGEELTAVIIAKIFKYYQLSEGVELFRQNVVLERTPCNNDDPDLATHLRDQVNEALMAMRVVGQAGSSDLPCYALVEGKVHGEYDVTLRNLSRVLNVHPRGAHESILNPGTLAHVRDELMTLDGGPVNESYSIYECGNTQRDVGPPESRAEHYTFASDAEDALEDAGNAIGNGIGWFVQNILIPFLLSVIALSIASALISGIIAAAVAAGVPEVVAAATVAAGVIAAGAVLADDPLIVFAGCAALPITSLLPPCRIPETENHLLMMNSSAYFTNQIRSQYLTAPNQQVPHQMRNNVNGLEAWFLDHFQQFLTSDFEEYNARPYQRYSFNSILNLYDYATDLEVQRAAGMVLDYLASKYAVSTNVGRRVVDFRRRAENTNRTRLYEASGGADHLVNAFMMFSGQVDLLPPEDRGAQEMRALEMIYAAVSNYRMPTAALEVAVDKSAPYFQVVHHVGVEIFASYPSFLISAGGVRTGPANRLAFSGAAPDYGVALPTVLIPTAGLDERNELIRFEGGEEHDGNTCVAPGFACGLNPVIPSLYDACKVTSGDWTFINSAACALTDRPPGDAGMANPGPYFYAAVYSASCTNDDYCVTYQQSCTDSEHEAWADAVRDAPLREAEANIALNLSLYGPLAQRQAAAERSVRLSAEAAWLRREISLRAFCTSQDRRAGMLEAIDAPLIDRDGDGDRDAADMQIGFDTFRTTVLANNTGAIFNSNLEGRYAAADGQTVITFDPARSEKDEDQWALRSYGGQNYDEWTSWHLAQGDIMQANGSIVDFRSPISGLSYQLDFSDANNAHTTPDPIQRGN